MPLCLSCVKLWEEQARKSSVLGGGIYLNEGKGREMIELELELLNIRLTFLVLPFFKNFKCCFFLIYFYSGIGNFNRTVVVREVK